MKTSEIFAACIPLIENDKWGFICHALCDVVNEEVTQDVWLEFQDSNHPAHNIIMDRLAGLDHILSFALDMRDILYEVMQPDIYYPVWSPTDSELKAIRIAWLHSLVAEFQQIGA